MLWVLCLSGLTNLSTRKRQSWSYWGEQDVKTTMIYTHVLNVGRRVSAVRWTGYELHQSGYVMRIRITFRDK